MIQLVDAEWLVFDRTLGADVQRVKGNAIFKHKTATLYCDSAYFYGSTNSVKAFGHVHINDNDTVNIYSDSLYYNGETRLANLFGNVRLIDPQMTLTTNILSYDLKDKKGYYNGGGRIVDQNNQLTSRTGIYFTNTKDIFFKKDVVLTNPEYLINCDTLIYNTNTKIARFHGPTTIVSDENTIFCENGWYNTDTDQSRFSVNAYLKNKNQKISGDQMFYDRKRDFGTATRNVLLTDSANKTAVYSHYVEYHGIERFAKSTDSTLAIIEDDEQDSVFLHADTLLVFFDSTQKAKLMLAFHKTLMYKSNLQAACDSLVYSFIDSVIQFYTYPVLWSEGSQITGDFIEIFTNGESPDMMDVKSNAFLMSHDSLDYYNQISGRDMRGYFEEKTFKKLDVFGNAESVYFARDEYNDIIGVDIAVGSDLRIIVENEDIKDIIYFDEPVGTIYPIIDLSPNDMRLKGFVNYENARPKNRHEVFDWRFK